MLRINKNQLLCLLGLIFFCIKSNAQFGVNGTNGKKITTVGNACFSDVLREGDIEKLKKKTTYFVCPKQHLDEIETFQTILDEAWNFNEIVVIEDEELENHLKEKDAAFFSLHISHYGAKFQEAYYQLWTVKDFSKPVDSDNMTEYCRFTLYYTCELPIKWISIKNTEDLFDYLYSEAKFLNFKPAIIANYLKLFEKYLTEEKYLFCYEVINKADELKALKKDTLYITENVKNKYTEAFANPCELEEQEDAKKLMEDYKYPYEFISFDELNEKIESGEKFYYAICVRTQEYKTHISIFNNETGELILNVGKNGLRYRNTDFKLLVKDIEKKK